MPSSLLLLLFLSFPSAVISLSCYVCATGGLYEFGECKEQFVYDCTPYASKFPGERTYCRTTREDHRNGTFTVMKECISETDHYSRFPEKGYPLDEECDLVDVQGQEVAYCVCQKNVCNRDPIADQFMAFEEKHPELFGDVDSSKESLASAHVPLALTKKPSAAFAAPQVVPPAIVPVNDPRFSAPSSAEIRRQPPPQNSRPQLPSREGVNTGHFTLSRGPPVSQSGFVGTVGRDPAPAVPEPHRHVALPVAPVALPETPIVPVAAVARPGPPPPPAKPALRCTQCGERGLPDISSDCSQSSVSSCNDPNEICFTRMIVLSPSNYAVEKMCVLPESVRAQFGDGAVNGECGTASQGTEYYCTCTSNDCNRLPLHEQRGLRSPLPPAPAAPPPAPPSPVPVPVPVPELPLVIPQPEEEPKMPEPPKEHMVPQPKMPEPKVEEPVKPIVPAVVHHAKKKADLRCSTCSEEGITDPTADCAASATRDCRDGQTMCLTQQSQIENEFRMTKRCISSEEFSKLVPSESFEEGCATSEDGMINFCLCKGDKCNAQSLLSQAQSNGVRDTLEQARHSEEKEESNDVDDLPKVAAKEQPREQVPVIASGIPTHHQEEGNRIEVEKSAEDRELELRRQKWAEADLNTSISLSPLLPLCLLYLFY